MYWNKLHGITTLSCNERSIRLRPECPRRTRRYKIIPEESVHYWYLFLFPPPPAMLFFHLSSDHSKGNVSEDYLEFSRFQLLHHLLDVLVFHDEEDESISLWKSRFSSLWFCFGLWSACKILRNQLERKFCELNFWIFLLIVVQIHHKLV